MGTLNINWKWRWRTVPLRRLMKAVVVVILAAFVLSIICTQKQPLGLCYTGYLGHACGSAETVEQQFGPLPKDNAERLRRIRNTCRLARGGHVYRMTSHAGTRIAYCMVPKTSTTFWLSLLRFLHHDSHTHSNPLDIPRELVHQPDFQIMRFNGIKPTETLPKHLNDYFRFMFTRDPYSRLWSAYVDKFFLLDFWPTKGKRIAAFLQSAHSAKMLGRRRRPGPCFSDITFAEFAAYVAWGGDKAPEKLDEHWRPMEHLCNPCVFCPHLVGKVETFHQDSLPVLNRLNFTWVLQTYQHVLHQMELLMQDNFRWLSPSLEKDREFYLPCVNLTLICRRLWAAFHMYGYIPQSVSALSLGGAG